MTDDQQHQQQQRPSQDHADGGGHRPPHQLRADIARRVGEHQELQRDDDGQRRG
jgi:hypothetical protein